MNFETMPLEKHQELQESNREALEGYVNALEAEAIKKIDHWEDEKLRTVGRRKVVVWKTLTELAIIES